MYMNTRKENREKVALSIERDLTLAAGVVRNRIIDGMDYRDALKHESVMFYLKSAQKRWDTLRDEEVNLYDGQAPDFTKAINI